MKKPVILFLALVTLLSCQTKTEPIKSIPMDSFVKMYITALREDALAKQYGAPESFPDSSLDRVLKPFSVTPADFKSVHEKFKKDPVQKNVLDSLIKQAIQTETMKSLNEKENEKNQ
jgi:pantothenate kinase